MEREIITNTTQPGNSVFISLNWRQSDKFHFPKREKKKNH